MAFLEQRIDAKITRGVVFTETVPGRTFVRLASGKTKQNFQASAPLTLCDLSHGVRSAAEYQTLLDAWYVVMFTPYEGLRVRNWRDYIATQDNSRCTFVTGSTTVLQLQRVHTFGGQTYLRSIKKPCAAPAPVVYRTRTGATSSIAASVETTTGLATISGHVEGDTYTWAGEFDLPMTFSANEWRASLEVSTINLHVVSGEIAMEELRL
jgi:uncharacterized protein (TIGR02217 family)